MPEKILLVDDDPQILRGYTRRLEDMFQIETALGGPEGLEAIDHQGSFAVVIADMRMPTMDGVQFLALVRDRAPQTVRMMLTGNADLQTAIAAVNQGYVFRFLTKPCPVEILIGALNVGLEQYRLICAERELLEKTLNGSIKLLVDILSLTNPAAFSRANRITQLVVQLATHLQLPNIWRFKLAALLSQIGYISLPHPIIEKLNTHSPLSESEQRIFAEHPAVGYQLLVNIPRLDMIAQIIAGQQQPYLHPVSPHHLNSDKDMIALGSQLLRLALDYDIQVSRGITKKLAIAMLYSRADSYNPHLLEALTNLNKEAENEAIKGVKVDELKIGMVIAQDVWSKTQVLLVHKGEEVTLPMLIRLRNFAHGIGVQEPISIWGEAQ